MSNGKRYSSELRERAGRLVFAPEKGHDSPWGAICSIAEKIGCTSKTLHREQFGPCAPASGQLLTSRSSGPRAT